MWANARQNCEYWVLALAASFSLTGTPNPALNSLTVLVAIAAASPVLAEDTRVCALEGIERRIEVRYSGKDRAPPCEVFSGPVGARQRALWSSKTDAAFCAAKSESLARILEGLGWSCVAEQGDEIAGPAPSPPLADAASDSVGSSVREARRSSAAAGKSLAERFEAKESPAEKTEGADSTPPDDEPSAARGGAASRPDTNETILVGSAWGAARALGAAVQRDLVRLEKTAGEDVEATVGSFGDLNGDNVDDAAVLLIFDADGDRDQYLVAYLADGGSYRAAARRYIGGRYRNVLGADVAAIRNGQVELVLQVPATDDPTCCPSETQAVAYRLENGELVGPPSDLLIKE
jgi:hypothetical protein